MKNTLLIGLLAGASLLSIASCSNPDYKIQDAQAVEPLPPLPPEPDTTGGKAAPQNPATREINAMNATEDIKKMQPQM